MKPHPRSTCDGYHLRDGGAWLRLHISSPATSLQVFTFKFLMFQGKAVNLLAIKVS
jgi:hypothetical protein